MSSTATTTTTSTSSSAVSAEAARLRNWKHLSDYELHHSDSHSEPSNAASANRAAQDPRLQDPTEPSSLQRALHNPDHWPNNHRRIPHYRPINRELDQSQRRVYQNTGERVFLTIMFTGVRTNVVSNFCVLSSMYELAYTMDCCGIVPFIVSLSLFLGLQYADRFNRLLTERGMLRWGGLTGIGLSIKLGVSGS